MTSQVHYRDFRFPVQVGWDGGRRTTARVEGKQSVRIATPPEFRGTDPELWSPRRCVCGRCRDMSGDDRSARRTRAFAS